MASLGELFIELGVIGDTKELDKALNTMKETIKAVDKQIQQSERLRRYREELAKATTKGEKDAIKNEFALSVKKNKLLEQKDALEQNIDANKNLAKNVAGVVKGIAGFVTAITGAIWAVNKFTNQLVQSNQAFLNLTRTSDISLNTFQKWDSVGKMLGVENAAQQIEGLNERLFELMLTGEGARGFQLAGINPMGQDANGVMEQIRNRISGLSDTSASYLLKQMGLDPQMLHLLRMSREEFEALNAEMEKYRLSPEQRASIQEMNIQLQIASQKLKYLKDRAILAIMPYFVDFVNMMVKVADGIRAVVRWLNNSKSGWATLTRIVLGATAALAGIVTVIKTLPVLIGGVTLAIRILQGALVALTAHPIIAGLTALIGAIMLIADDIIGYNNGKDSLIGTIINGLEDLDIKGFIDFPVPEWLEYLIEVIHFYKSGGFNNGISRKDLNLDSLKDSTYQLFPEAMNFDQQKAQDIISRIQRIKDNPFWGNEKKNEEIYKLINSADAIRQHNITNEDNRTASTNTSNVVNQNIQIHTEQPAQSIQDELAFTQFAFSYG